MTDPVDINRFLDAHNLEVNGFEDALEEINLGCKRGQWIWYIFPQLRGLGHSKMANYYGISGIEEAEEFINNPTLNSHLRQICTALLRHPDKSAEDILGHSDAMKLQSSMTLFDSISPDDIFAEVLEIFFDGERDESSILGAF